MPLPTRSDHLIRSYGRKRGRKLRTGKQQVIDTLLPGLTITLPESGQVLPQEWFGNDRELWLEIGFGGGEHLVAQAERQPNINFIGCEPFINGIASLLAAIDDAKINNLRIYEHDVRLMMERLPDQCLSGVYILFPDPWPKIRHHKRRLVSAPFLSGLHRLLKKNAFIRLATDHPDYGMNMLIHFLNDNRYRWTATRCADWQERFKDSVATRYEQKALAGHLPIYLEFIRQ